MEPVTVQNDSVLTWHHPRFGEFAACFSTLLAPDGIGWEGAPPGHAVTRCVLQHMGGLDVEQTIEWMKAHGACCDDIEVGMNIIGTYWDMVDRGEIPPWGGEE